MNFVTADSRPGGLSSLRTLGAHHLLFSEPDQAVYELDELAAHIWRSLRGGLPPDAVVEEILGVDPRLRDAVERRLAELRDLGTSGAARAAGPATAPETLPDFKPALTLDIAGAVVQLELPTPWIAAVRSLFGHLSSPKRGVDVQIRARPVGNDIELITAYGRSVYEESAWLPALKMELIGSVLRHARYEIALHAAALVRKDRVLLLVGSPGAGKTTLAMGLSNAGWALDADDVVLMRPDGKVRGISLPFAAKAGSWPLVAGICPAIMTAPIHRRPDGQTVRFSGPPIFAKPRWRAIDAVILLDRRPEAATGVEDVDPTETLVALVAEADSPDHRLSALGFSALVTALNAARCCRLTYSDFGRASDALKELCC